MRAAGIRLDSDDGVFVKMIGDSVGGEIPCTVFNTQTLRTRETVIRPTANWGGAGLLGVCATRHSQPRRH